MRTLITIAGTLLAGATPFAASAALRPEAATVAGPGEPQDARFASVVVTARAPQDRQDSELEELRRAVDELRAEKDRLRAEIEAERAGAGAGSGSTTRTETRREVRVRRIAEAPQDDTGDALRTRWHVATTPESEPPLQDLWNEEHLREVYEGAVQLEGQEALLVELESVQADLKAALERAAREGGDLRELRVELARVQSEALRAQAQQRALEAKLHAAEARSQELRARERMERELHEAQRDTEREAEFFTVLEQAGADGEEYRALLRRIEQGEAQGGDFEFPQPREGVELDFDRNLYLGPQGDGDATKHVIVRTRKGDATHHLYPGTVSFEGDGDAGDGIVWIDVDGERHALHTGGGKAPSRSFIHDSDGVVIDVQRRIYLRGDDGELVELGVEEPEPPATPMPPVLDRLFSTSGGSGSAPSATGGGRIVRVERAPRSGGGRVYAPRDGADPRFAPRVGSESKPAPRRDDLLLEVHELTRAMLGELRELRAAVDELRRDVDTRHDRTRAH